MNRRSLLQMVGLAPVAATVGVEADVAEADDYLNDLICNIPPVETPTFSAINDRHRAIMADAIRYRQVRK